MRGDTISSGNWIIDNLNSSLETWNGKLSEIWTLLTTSPESFKGGGIWNVIVGINDALKAIAYALLVLFFVDKVEREYDAGLLEFTFYSRRKQALTKGHPRYRS